MKRRRRLGGVLAWIVLTAIWLADHSPTAWAAKVTMKDGRELTGRMAQLTGVSENPLAEDSKKSTDPVGSQSVVMIDNDLTRVMVPKRQILNLDQTGDTQEVEIKLSQPVARVGQRVVSVGPIQTPKDFDDFGRRTIIMTTAKGPTEVVQGITSITPTWTKIEGLISKSGISYVWDMRLATSSIPRETLVRIMNRTNANGQATLEQRLQVVKLFVQSERYKDASAELELIVHDFPKVAALTEEVVTLKKLNAKRILAEMEVRRKAGQHELALAMLRQFPTDGVPGEVLAQVHSDLQKYEKIQAEGQQLIALLDEYIKKSGDSVSAREVALLRSEMQKEISFNTMARLAAFKRLASDDTLLPQQTLSLAVTGWLLGSDDAEDNVKVALALVDIRAQVREFLNEPTKLNRDKLMDRITESPYANARMVAKLVNNMKPPVDTPPQKSSGFFELTVPGMDREPDVTYYVQLPPEYDPFRQYPAVVTLNASWTTPLHQVDWWAGPQSEAGRLGQAGRQGYIVIAPAWSAPHQKRYEYSAREHAAVLSTLRDACRRFSIDTDRVFLSGHSMGGDAAWDIGLAHPDLWAGVIPIVATADKYIPRYDHNARNLPLYFICGEYDGDRMNRNSLDLNRYFISGFDVTVIEYLGRGHENFSDEVVRLFDWMDRKHRDFFPRQFTMSTMRPWDNFFYWVELRNMPPRTMIDPTNWPPAANTLAMKVEAKLQENQNLNVRAQSAKVTLWLSPELVDFDAAKPITITVNGKALGGRLTLVQPDLKVLLEDVRTRGDRKHPFWAKVENN